jgi:aldose 1-epimerase
MKIFNRFLFLLIFTSIFLEGCRDGSTKTKAETNNSVKMSIMKENWGKVDNKDVFLYTLKNNNGIVVKITNYGGIVTSILIPDKNGKMGDITLGYDNLKGYQTATPYFGALVGRYANRIAKGTFKLDNKVYKLAINNGNNSLHGGLKGFDKVVWDAKEINDSTGVGLILTYLSKDGEEGYPGNVSVMVTYLLDSSNKVKLTIEAQTDKPTPVNLCNHTYFNLREADTNVLGHRIMINSDYYTPVNDELIPTGEQLPVKGTPMDFKDFHSIGERIDKVKGGYDHNYMIIRKDNELSLAAVIEDPISGRKVSVFTTQPGVQFYTGNFLDGTITGKEGKVYKQHFGLCLETQHFPDSPNQPSFPNTILRPGEKFQEVTLYKFEVAK